jgi:hypothetical protein
MKDFWNCVSRNKFPPLFVKRLQLLRKLQLSNVSIKHKLKNKSLFANDLKKKTNVILFYFQKKLEKMKEKEIQKQQYETKRQREKREYYAFKEERKNRQRDTLIEQVYTKVRIKHYQNFVKKKNVCFLQSQNLIPIIPVNLPSSSCLTATKIKSAFPVPRYYSTNIKNTLLIPKKIRKKDF